MILNKILLAHPTGNANVRAIVNGLKKAGLLEKFVTCIAYFNDSLILKTNIRNVERRKFDEILKHDTLTHPWKEIGRLLAVYYGFDFLTSSESSIFNINKVYKGLDKFLSKRILNSKELSAVYCYEDGSYYSFQAAKEMNLSCIYDLPIAYWQTTRELLSNEAERYPQWKITLKDSILNSKEKLRRKTIELELADIIVVPSKFVAQSLPEWASNKKVIVSPFGTPVVPHQNESQKKLQNRPLRVLFVGSMSQRKGLADLFNAVKLLHTSQIELIVLGSLSANLSFYRKELPSFSYEVPRPHNEVLDLMATCDVFCLPSVVEGRALVMQEAMSRNLPVIITKNTGGEDLVIEGKTGFLVPVGNPEEIAKKLDWFIANRNIITDMGQAAAIHAADYTWEKYSNTIIETLKETVI